MLLSGTSRRDRSAYEQGLSLYAAAEKSASSSLAAHAYCAYLSGIQALIAALNTPKLSVERLRNRNLSQMTELSFATRTLVARSHRGSPFAIRNSRGPSLLNSRRFIETENGLCDPFSLFLWVKNRIKEWAGGPRKARLPE